jgi:hypothetical protein
MLKNLIELNGRGPGPFKFNLIWIVIILVISLIQITDGMELVVLSILGEELLEPPQVAVQPPGAATIPPES